MNDAVWLPEGERTVEGFAARWEEINAFTNLIAPQSGSEQSGQYPESHAEGNWNRPYERARLIRLPATA